MNQINFSTWKDLFKRNKTIFSFVHYKLKMPGYPKIWLIKFSSKDNESGTSNNGK